MTLPVLTFASASHASDSYLLGPQDKLRIRVFEWRRSQDRVVQWEGLNDEFTVSADGTVSLPLVGVVPALDKTPTAVAQDIAGRLQRRMNLIAPPDTSVEVAQYRPIYVVGDVMKPGAFPFRPGMIVIQAVSLAEGLLRTPSQARDMVTVQGEMGQISLRRDALIARKARLESEAAGSGSIAFPATLLTRQTAPAIAALMQQEMLIFKTRAEAYRTQTEALNDLKDYLEKEVSSLEAQMGAEMTQTDLLNKELDGVSSLVAKGLAAAPRQYALERTKAEIQGDRLRLEAGMLRARQEISKADLSLLELKNKREGDIALDIRQTEQELQELANRGNVAQGLLRQISPLSLARGRATPVFMIMRAGQPGTDPVVVKDTDAVLPGDTVIASLPELAEPRPQGLPQMIPGEAAVGPDAPSASSAISAAN
ncbi:polysaccharide biosynthesis/export family protein [Ancylobacter sp. MQZ15Z-1]|uniref:Polysaccharide biosynthesis/export family protein n=1 Tax=Ancylobacter mangrovi TaxID=2972472 RepID=A0A9X2PDG8_9HYPH|nr:polysaccharide biosynthesis/export family protein [Ancylobacter mangrovi]MCS0493965.1 polysaccharide biosynthesis/export family protein [Ancylobacter mangrovi]